MNTVTENKVPVMLPRLDEALKYNKQRFEKAQTKAFQEKMKFAILLEAAVAEGHEDFSKYDLDEDQVNAILDWKRDFEEYENQKNLEREGTVSLMDARHLERQEKIAARRNRRK